eukprot:scaffold1185_cov143-Skeletonema_menzelii.AAC.10
MSSYIVGLYSNLGKAATVMTAANLAANLLAVCSCYLHEDIQNDCALLLPSRVMSPPLHRWLMLQNCCVHLHGAVILGKVESGPDPLSGIIRHSTGRTIWGEP